MLPSPARSFGLSLAAFVAASSPAIGQRRATPTPTPPPSMVAPQSAPQVVAGEESDGVATFSLRLNRGRGAEYPRADYSRASVRVTPMLDHNRPAYQLYGRARFYTLDGAYHDLSCAVVVYADGTTLASNDYPCREQSGEVDLANAEGISVVTLSDRRIEFRVATATMITSRHVYRDIVFRLESPRGELLVPPRDYRP